MSAPAVTLSVLIVTDRPDAVGAVAVQLTRHGHTVGLVAVSGASAQKPSPDVVILCTSPSDGGATDLVRTYAAAVPRPLIVEVSGRLSRSDERLQGRSTGVSGVDPDWVVDQVLGYAKQLIETC